ncbi:MAG: transcriptional regulator, partial [Sporichthyaceae bacterium]
SGYVETLGTLQLPVADRFTDVGDLFGQRTRMRVWWRGPDDWRVDKVFATGETDLFHDARGTTVWDYEKARAVRMHDPDIRLPRTSDLLPPELGRRLLKDVDTSELQRLPAEHLAGRDAPGLRLTPTAPQSSINHVDLWVDPNSGIPLRLAVYAKGDKTAAFTSEFMQFSAARPSASDTAFEPPPGADFSFDDVIDVADAADQFAPLVPPHTVAGLSRSRSAGLGAVGVYGRGVTQLVAIPLWDGAAEPLREQLEITPGVRLIDEGDVLSVGPLGILLTQFPYYGGGWLIAGTVTEDTLIQAAHDVQQARTVLR